MSYTINKNNEEIVFSGFEKGIAPSPHVGIADIKGVNLSSMPGEVMVNYSRTRQTQFKSITNSLTASTANTLIAAAGSTAAIGLLHGTWITITSSSITNLTNGITYYVKSSTTGTITISATYEGSIINTLGLTGVATFTVVPMGRPIAWAASNASLFPDYGYFVLDSTGYIWYKGGATGFWGMIDKTAVANAGGLFCFGSYIFVINNDHLKYKSFGALATAWSDFQTVSNGNATISRQAIVSHNSVAYWCDGSGIGSLAHAVGTFDPTSAATYTYQQIALAIPNEDTATVISEIGTGSQTTLLVGGQGSVLYPWDGLATTYGALVYLPESNTVQMVTVNNLTYVFCGTKGNVYVTNGSSLTSVVTVPDYIANNTGTNQDPYFIWGGAMYLRGRVWFSVKAANCGGVWSFVPTVNYYIQQDMGASLKLENQNSYATYSGYASVLFPALASTDQQANGPQYYAGWDDGTSGVSSNPYGIDYSATTPFIGGSIIETDLVPTGTLLTKTTFKQIEYKLAAQLAAGESVQIYYRKSLTDSFTSCGNAIAESTTDLSGYFAANFEKTQWLQLRIVLTAIASGSSWVRLTNVMVR